MMELSPALERLNEEVDIKLGERQGVSPRAFSAPRVAITAHLIGESSALARAYSDALIAVGAIPLIIPITSDVEVLYQTLQSVDALLLSGGADIHPMFMGEEPQRGLGEVALERDNYELRIIRIARRLCLPILGICRGHQILSVAYGSVLYQDLVSQFLDENALDHAPQIAKGQKHHKLKINHNDSGVNRLEKILQWQAGDELWVNSLHHQAIRELFPPFDEVATASDGVNEAIDAYPELDILAVQWHPEQMLASGDTRQRLLFEDLVERAKLYQRARAFHREHIVLDSHVDTPMFFAEDFDLRSSTQTRVDLTKMRLGDVAASVMVAYLPQGEVSAEAHARAKDYAEDKLSTLHEQVGRNKHSAMICVTPQDVRLAKSKGLAGIIPAIENAYAIGEDLGLLKYFRDAYGLAYVTLSHNGDNALCDSAVRSRHTYGGLSDLGREAVQEMNRLGIMVDVSHAGEDTVRDVLSLSTAPIIASHSSVHQLCPHPRNLTDEQIIAIAERGGVVQVCLYAGFIHEDSRRASILDAVEHIEHIVRLVGVHHVGIGSDFDGDGEVIGCRTSEDLIRLTIELLRRGYTEEDLRLLWGENFLRVWATCQELAAY